MQAAARRVAASGLMALIFAAAGCRVTPPAAPPAPPAAAAAKAAALIDPEGKLGSVTKPAPDGDANPAVQAASPEDGRPRDELAIGGVP